MAKWFDREDLEYFGDGYLISACTIALGIALGLGAAAAFGFDPFGEGGSGPAVPVVSIVSSVLFFAGGIAGPILAWLAHRRKPSWVALLGAVIGAGLIGVVLPAFGLLAGGLSLLLAPVWKSEVAGALVAGGLLVVAFVAMIVWLVAGAVRDLVRRLEERKRLALMRIGSASVLLVYVVAWIVIVLTVAGDGDWADPGAFVLAFGLSGGLAVLGADLATKVVARRGAPEDGVTEGASREAG